MGPSQQSSIGIIHMAVVFSIDNHITDLQQRVNSLLEPLGGMEKFIKKGEMVLIKPNLVAPFHHAVTDFELIRVVINEIIECGGIPLIGESAGFEFNSETTFDILGIKELAEQLKVEFVNFDNEEYVEIKLDLANGRKVKIPKVVLESDKIINMPKLKRHSLTKATIGIKNLFGMLDYPSRRRLHAFGLESGIFALGQSIVPSLVIVDGSIVTERAVYGKQKRMNLLAASKNITAMDVFCCQYLDLNWEDVDHIKLSVEKEQLDLKFETINVSDKLNDNDEISKPYSIPKHLKWNDSLLKKIHRFGYKVIYFFDLIFNHFVTHYSIIPVLHYYLGIRPVFQPRRCNDCGKCLPICPVDAIDIANHRILAKRCMPVRCLECIPVCPENAISVRGRSIDPSITERLNRTEKS